MPRICKNKTYLLYLQVKSVSVEKILLNNVVKQDKSCFWI